MGVGHLVRVAEFCIHNSDGMLLYSLLLPMMGLCNNLGKSNLRKQCFQSLLKLIVSPPLVALKIITNATVSRTGHPHHDVAADEELEIR